jgi:hypothetical protein
MMKLGISLVLVSDIDAHFSGLVYRELRDGTGASRLDYAACGEPTTKNRALDASEAAALRYPSTFLGR